MGSLDDTQGHASRTSTRVEAHPATSHGYESTTPDGGDSGAVEMVALG